MGRGVGDGDLLGGAGGAGGDFDGAGGDAAGADGDAVGDDDEVDVAELDAGAFGAVVEDDLNVLCEKGTVEGVGGLGHLGGVAELGDCHGEGGDGKRPDDAGVVVMGFDNGGEGALYADAVA